MDYEILRLLISKGAQISETNIRLLVREDDLEQLAIFQQSADFKQAASSYLAGLDSKEEASAEWKAAHSGVLSALRALI